MRQSRPLSEGIYDPYNVPTTFLKRRYQKAIRIPGRSPEMLQVIEDIEYADASLSKSERAVRRLLTVIQDNAWERFFSRDVLRRDLKG